MNEVWTGIEPLSRSRAKLYFDYPSRIKSYKWWWFFGILTIWGTFGIMLIVWAIISKKKINKECPRDQEMEAEYARAAGELKAEALAISNFGEDDLTRETDVVWGPDIHTYDKFCPYRSRKALMMTVTTVISGLFWLFCMGIIGLCQPKRHMRSRRENLIIN